MASTHLESPQRPPSKPEPEPAPPTQDSQRQRTSVWKGSLALADQAVVSVTTLLTMILVSRLIPDQLTVYALAWTLLSFVKVAQERMIGAPYMIFAHEPKRNQATYLGSSLTQNVVFAAATACGLGLFAAFAEYLPVPTGTQNAFLVLAGAAPFVLLRDHLRVVCCTHFNYISALAIGMTACLIQVGGVLTAHSLGHLSVSLVFVLMGVSSVVPCAIWLIVHRTRYRFDRQRFGDDWDRTWRYSRWLVAARCFPTAATSLLPWIVLWQIDEPSAGIFASCCTLANVSMMFMIGSNNYFQPRTVKALVERGKAAMCRELFEAVALFSVVLTCFCVVFFFFGDELLVRIFGPHLAGNTTVMCVLGVYMLIVGYSMVAGNGMAALERPRGLFFGEVAFGTVTIGLAWWLSPIWGLVGTALALCVGSLASTLIAGSTFLYLLSKIPPGSSRVKIAGPSFFNR